MNINLKIKISFLSFFLDILFISIGYLINTSELFWANVYSDLFQDFFLYIGITLVISSATALIFDKCYLNKVYISNSIKAYKFILYFLSGLVHKFQFKHLKKHNQYAFLMLLVKIIFFPLMLKYSFENFDVMFSILNAAFQSETFTWIEFSNYYIYPIVICFLFFIDTYYYLFGYLFYHESLGNKVKSVETTFLGWFSALLCYPPLFWVTAYFFPLYINQNAFFFSQEITFLIRIAMILLITIYTLSTMSLGWKSSNLTNRGIVSKGTYAFVRHPAYASKNLFWWIALIPTILVEPMVVFYMIGLTSIYLIRAYTEERHLSKDTDYIEYCSKVKYRFIPKIY